MTFTVGTTGNFTIDAVGSPVPKWTYTGPLPAGVIFVDNGDGSATLAGKPQAGTGGTYPLVLTAANGVGTAPTEDFTLTVNEAPTFTNTVAATFSAEAAGSFLFTTAGFPTSALSESGPLPSGVTFVDNHNGTATLSGISSAGTAGTYHLTITATNNVGAGTTQPFTLTVNPSNNPTSSNPSPSSPTITSAGSTMFSTDSGNEFQVTASGTPSPTISLTGALPPGVTFVDNHNGTATLTGNPAMGSAGAYHLTITAANGVGAAVTEDFTLDVVIATPPAVVRLQRIGAAHRRAQIVLSFNQPMALTAAELASNYVLRPVVRGRAVNKPHQLIRVRSAVYDSTNQTVTLRAAKPLNLHRVYQITVNGLAPSGLTNVSGVALDGRGDGRPSSNFVLSFAARASLRGIT